MQPEDQELDLTALKLHLGVIHEEDLANIRKIEVPALRNERSRGEGPPFVKLGASVFYPVAALRKFIEAQTVVPSPAAPTLVDGGRGGKRRSRPESTPTA